MKNLVLRESAGLRYFTFFYLYVMQGIPAGFGLTTVANYLIGRNLSAPAVATFTALVGLPWTIQFVWGPLIDKYQYSVIGHRKQWVVLTQLAAVLASLGLLSVHDPVTQLPLLTGAFVVHSVFASVQDASVDAIAISVVPAPERGRANAFMRAGMLIGGAAGAAGLTAVLHQYGFFWAALVQSGVLLAFTVLTFFIRLDQTDSLLPVRGQRALAAAHNAESPTIRWLFRELWRAVTEHRTLRLFGGIALAYVCLSVFGWAYNYHLIRELHWSDRAVSTVQGSWGSLATLALFAGGGVLADKVGPGRLQRWVLVGLAGFLLIFCGLSGLWQHHAVALAGLVVWNMADPSLSVVALPLLMALCRPQIEGSQFTTYMALVNLCGVSGGYLTGWALTWLPAPALGLLCGGGLLLMAVVLWRQQLPATASVPEIPA